MARGNLSVAQTPGPTEYRFDFAPALAQALTQSVAAALRAALQACDSRTPAQFLTLLSEQERAWTKVRVSLVDERSVAEDPPDSNAAPVRKRPLQNDPVGVNFVPVKNAADTPARGGNACTNAVEAMPRRFAMLVPCDDATPHRCSHKLPRLAQALAKDSGQPWLGADPVTAWHPRLTLTLPALLASRRIATRFTGAGKRAWYQQALQRGPVGALSIRAVLRQDRVPSRSSELLK
jgi:6-phosphogluconolactonase